MNHCPVCLSKWLVPEGHTITLRCICGFYLSGKREEIKDTYRQLQKVWPRVAAVVTDLIDAPSYGRTVARGRKQDPALLALACWVLGRRLNE